MAIDPVSILGLLRVLANLGSKGTALSGLGGGDATGGLGLLSSLLGLSQGISGENPGQAAQSGLTAVGQAANLAGYPGVGALTGPLAGVAGAATGNPGALLTAAPSTLTGLGTLAGGSGATAGAAATGAIAPTLGTMLSGIGGALALPAAAIGMGLANEKAQQANRMQNIGREQQRFAENYNIGIPQLAQGAIPDTDPLTNYAQALTGLKSLAAMSPAAGHSGTKTTISGGTLGGDKTMRYPDYSQAINVEQGLVPFNVLNLLRARDALVQGGQDLTTPPETTDKPEYISREDLLKNALNVSAANPNEFQKQATYETDEYGKSYMKDPYTGGVSTAAPGTWEIRPDIQQHLASLPEAGVGMGILDILRSINPNFDQSQLGQILGGGA